MNRFNRLANSLLKNRQSIILLDMALLELLAAAFYLPTFSLLVAEWFRPGIRLYSHGPLVFVFSFLLLWWKRRALAQPQFSWWGLLVLLLSGLLYYLGKADQALYLIVFSFIALLLGLLLLTFGRKATRTLLFPILYLILAVPFPPVFWAAEFLTKIVGFPAAAFARLVNPTVEYSPAMGLYMGSLFQAGIIQVQNYYYLIVPLCSGINFIMALLGIILPFLYLTHSTWSRAILFVIVIPPVALMLKVLLLAVVVVLTPSLGQDKAVEYYHTWLGLPAFWLGVVSLMIPLLLTRHKRDIIRPS